MTAFLDELNDAQRAAVENIEGPMMVLAGAGSGKTRVLTYRIAYLMECGIDPFNILALTFTNKAAREMRDRIERVIGSDARNIWMGTFHSIFARILRFEAHLLGYPQNFTIYDTDDTKSLLKTIVNEMQLNKDNYKPGMLYGRISTLKNNFVSVKEYLEDQNNYLEDKNAGRPKFGEVYREYITRCFKSGAMDFDDILLKTYELFNKHPDALNKYQHKFKFILVDEYQDTNSVQYNIIKKLASVNQNICVVGDDAQSIYAFRGANIKNILNFEKDYPDFKIFKLEQNYRSTKVIVEAAGDIIKNNREQLEKKIWTANDDGEKIKVFVANSEGEEGRIIASSIFEEKMNSQAKNDEFAILYRTNAQSRSFEESLRKLNLPYRIIGGLSFYQRKEIKDLLAYMRVILNPNDEEALKRIINYPTRGIGKSTLDKVLLYTRQRDQSIWQTIQQPHLVGLSPAICKRIQYFATLMQGFMHEVQLKDAYEVASTVAKSSSMLKTLYEDKSIEGISRYENIQELLAGIKEFVAKEDQEDKSLGAYMQDVALLTDADTKDDGEEKITLMTIHGAKGLEFPFVYIVGLEENLFPSQLSLQSRTELEEERRLFYVAITRAEQKCTLSYARQRFKWGQLTYGEPSRFIDELDSSRLDYQLAEQGINLPKPKTPPQGFKRFQPGKKQPFQKSATAPNFKSDPPGKIKVGQTVEHARFGVGQVASLEGGLGNEKATIDFKDFGQKLILLKFAKLRVINND